MRKQICIYFFCTLFLYLGTGEVHAQKKMQKTEFGLFGGGSYYIGDLNPYKHYDCAHGAYGAFVRYNMSRRLNMRYAYTYGLVTGNDATSDDEFRQNRNLSFKSPVHEFSAILEINFTTFEPGNKLKHYASPYLFMGLGMFKMNPMAQINDQWFELQALGTEGQGSDLNDKNKYALTQICIPLGIGFKGNLTRRIVIGFEYGIRKTFTDFLDDVSGYYADSEELSRVNGPLAAEMANRSVNPENGDNAGMLRGNPNNKDWYSFSGMTISIKLGDNNTCGPNMWKN